MLGGTRTNRYGRRSTSSRCRLELWRTAPTRAARPGRPPGPKQRTSPKRSFSPCRHFRPLLRSFVPNVDVYCERAKELATLMIAASVVLNHVLAVNGLSNCATDRAVRSCAPTCCPNRSILREVAVNDRCYTSIRHVLCKQSTSLKVLPNWDISNWGMPGKPFYRSVVTFCGMAYDITTDQHKDGDDCHVSHC